MIDCPNIRVLHLITRMDMGGSAQNTLMTSAGLSQRFRVILGFGPTQESSMTVSERETVERTLEAAIADGMKTVRLQYLLRRIHPIWDCFALLEIIRLLRRFRPLILHTHTSKAGLLGRIAAVLVPVPIVVHTPHGHVFYGHFGRVASWIFLYIERILDRFTTVTISLTRGEFDDYVKMRVIPRKKMTVIHSGVDIDRFFSTSTRRSRARKTLGCDDRAVIIGTVGWLLPIKGPDVLLHAMNDVWREYPHCHLVFVGKGEMKAKLKQMAKESGKADHVHFLGWRDDIWNIIPAFDIFVLPSRNEGMGRVVVEAMAAGKPVIASRVGGVPDLIEDGVNGYLFTSEDSDQLASRIAHLIQNPGKAKAMGREGQQRSKAYSTEAMVEKIDALYRKLISEKIDKQIDIHLNP
jgi:glycosyltransferase involved in cell wall biosynthesis